MRKIKLLFVFYTLEAGGAERNLINIANLLSEKEYFEIKIFVFRKSNTFEKYISRRIDLIFYNDITEKTFKKISDYILFGYALSRIPDLLSFNYIIAIHEHLPEIAVRAIKFYNLSQWREIKKKSVLVVHFSPLVFINSRNNIMKRYFHKYIYLTRINNFNKIVVISKQIHSEHFYKKKVKLIVNPIYVNKIIQLSNEKTNVIKSKYFVHIGSIQEIKNQLFILDSLKEENKKYEFEIIFIGRIIDNVYYKKLLDRIIELEDKVKIRFLGELINPFPILKHSLGLINVSLYESFSHVIHEAMVLKVPVISFLNNNNEFITNDNVIYVKKNHLDLISKLILIASKELDTSTASNNAFKYVQQFDVKKIVTKYDDLFRT